MLEPRCQQWHTGADWNGDQEVTDDATFFQLWVDMETGFIRRIAKEELDGRTWDLAVTSLRINGEISADTFDLGI
jgi:outer membrane lipoprotein-sorting protein